MPADFIDRCQLIRQFPPQVGWMPLPRPNTGFPYSKEEAERAKEENMLA